MVAAGFDEHEGGEGDDADDERPKYTRIAQAEIRGLQETVGQPG